MKSLRALSNTARHLALGLAALVALGTGMAAYVHFSPERARPPADPAIATAYPDLDGRPTALSRWRGQVVAVNFWASWCPPCREEIPAFARVHEALRGRGFTVVGIAVEDAAPARAFAEQAGIPYPVLAGGFAALDEVRRLGNPGGGLPYTVILDRDGKVVSRHLGGLDEARLRRTVEPFLPPAR